MSRKNESLTISLDAADKATLEALALEFDCVWGEKPNLSELMRAIAQGRLKVINSDTKEQPLIKSKQGMQAMSKIIQGLTELSVVLFR